MANLCVLNWNSFKLHLKQKRRTRTLHLRIQVEFVERLTCLSYVALCLQIHEMQYLFHRLWQSIAENVWVALWKGSCWIQGMYWRPYPSCSSSRWTIIQVLLLMTSAADGGRTISSARMQSWQRACVISRLFWGSENTACLHDFIRCLVSNFI